MQKIFGSSLILSLLISSVGFAKVYRNIPVGKYESSFSLKDCNGKTFLNFMEEKIYPAMEKAAKKKTGGQHIDGVKKGEGVEIRLTDDVTTFHVKYKAASEPKAERSGRSFGAIGKNRNNMDYVADASDSYYLSSLEKIARDEKTLKAFYETILGVVVQCDAKGFSKLNTQAKEVAADFIAVLVAEQYRHLTGGRGKLGSSFNWDDALIQVTLLASFHSGQEKGQGGMFYEGKFTDEVYDQIYEEGENKICVYKQFKDPRRANLEKRKNQLNDYWQFNRVCERSGINMTRSDFSKMARAISAYMAKHSEEEKEEAAKFLGRNSHVDMFDGVASYLINDSTPKDLSDKAEGMIESIVAYLMEVRANAPEITASLDK